MIADKEWRNPSVPAWVLVLNLHLSATERGIVIRFELRRMHEGKLESFSNHIPQFHGLQVRECLSTERESWTSLRLQFLRFGYYGLARVDAENLQHIGPTLRLLERRRRDYYRRHGHPTTIGGCAVALAAILGAHNIHVVEEGYEQFYSKGPKSAAWRIDSTVKEMNRVHALSRKMKAAETAGQEGDAKAVSFIQEPTSPAEIAAIRRCFPLPEQIRDHIISQLQYELKRPGGHASVGDFWDYHLWLTRRPDQWRFHIQWVRHADTGDPICPATHAHLHACKAAEPHPEGHPHILIDGRNHEVLTPARAACHQAEGLPVLRCYIRQRKPC
jgi:hypothetical protein